MCDILPRTQSFFEDQQVEVSLLDDINTEASTVNHALHLVSEILPWVDNVQFPSFLQDSVIKRHFLSRDGLHLSFRATKYVADTITRSILKHLNHQEKDITTEIFSSPDWNNSPDSDSRLNCSQDSDLSVNTSPDSSNKIRLIGDGSENYEIKSGDTFSSFDEFRNKFEIWCQDKCFPMKIGGSEKLPNSSPAFPYKMVRYLCKHAGKPRSRGQAKRPVQQYLATGCEAVCQ